MKSTNTNDSSKRSSCPRSVRHLLVLAGAVASGFLVALAANELFPANGPRKGLRSRGNQPITSNSLQSWLSFSKQTGALGLTEVEVVQVPSNKRQKVMELKDPERLDISSNDEEVIVKVVEHKDPDLSESGKDEFELEFEDKNQEFGQKEIEAALSKALRSGLRDSDQISKAVSNELKYRMKKTSTRHMLPQQDAQKDKP